MNITPIPEREAADLIGVSLRTIANAVKRGDLVRVPGTGITQHVAREQAVLFRGMKWVVKEHLSPSDLEKWEAVTDAINHWSTQYQKSSQQAIEAKEETKPALIDPKPSVSGTPTALFALTDAASIKLVDAMIDGTIPLNAVEYVRGFL